MSYAKRRKEKTNLVTFCIQIQNPYFLERLLAGACSNCLWKQLLAFSMSFRRDKLSWDARRKLEKFVNHDWLKSFFMCSPKHPAWVYALIICFPWDLFEAVRQGRWTVIYLVSWSPSVWKWAKKVQKNWIHLFVISVNERQTLYIGLTVKGWGKLSCYSW